MSRRVNVSIATKGNTALLEEAVAFLTQMYAELQLSQDERHRRIQHITKEIQEEGFYLHTQCELEYGAKVAWRNSNRCIGRLFWQSLHVIDRRHVSTPDEGYQALLEHIEYATNGGKIRPTITILGMDYPNHTGLRIVNDQLIRYGGYETKDGITGDPISIDLTKKALSLGWRSKRTAFDILPLMLESADQTVHCYDWPKEAILEVPLTHPTLEWFEELGLRWYAVPIVSNMRLEIGGISYHAAPFNGWYMGTEIGARNLADPFRYHLLPVIAKRMGLATDSNTTLWKDKALVELNLAVLHSYKEAGVSIVDHHTAAQQFMQFERKEQEQGRSITGDWTWLIPPMSPAATPIFHESYDPTWNKPNFFYRNDES